MITRRPFLTESLRLNPPILGGSLGEPVTAYRLNRMGKITPPKGAVVLKWSFKRPPYAGWLGGRFGRLTDPPEKSICHFRLNTCYH